MWQPAWIYSAGCLHLYWRCLAVLLFVYVALFGCILAVSDFLPYVMDNNETFSSIIHAKSMYYFGLAETFGLTDESYGLTAASHPFVYTHQGNFPRFPALLLYAMGATTAQSQIVIHTFTIGLMSVVLAFHFFSRHVRPMFALVACLIFITDYIFFVQWNVVTWRVWHIFFLFGGLLCVEGLANPRVRWRYATSAFVLWICLFYYEFIYAAFISATVGLYAIYYHRKCLRTIILTGAVLVSGALTSISILISQAVAFYGWNDFVKDATLTFVARNSAPDVKAYLAQLEVFFGERNLVFWYNVVDYSGFRNLVYFFGSLTWGYFSVYTPFITIATLMLATAWCLSVARGAAASARRSGLHKRPTDFSPAVVSVALALAGSAVVSAALVLGINATVNVGPKVIWPLLIIGMVAVIGLVRFEQFISALDGATRFGDLRSPSGLRGIRFAAMASAVLTSAALPATLPLPLNINGAVRLSVAMGISVLLVLITLFVFVAGFPRVLDLLARALARPESVKAFRGTLRLVLSLIALVSMGLAALMSALMIASRASLPMAALSMGLAVVLIALVVAAIWWRPVPVASLAPEMRGPGASGVVVATALFLASIWIIYALSGAPVGDAIAMAGGALGAAVLFRGGLGWGPGSLARSSIDGVLSSIQVRRAFMTMIVLVATMLPLLAMHHSLSGIYLGRYSTGYLAVLGTTAAVGGALAIAVLISWWCQCRPVAGRFLISLVRGSLAFWPILLLIVYVAAAWRFARLVMVDGRSLGLNPTTFPVVNDPWNLWLTTSVATACLVIVPALAMRTGSRLRRPDAFGPITGVVFLLAFHGFVGQFYQVYDVRLQPIWTAFAGSLQPLLKGMIILIAALSISLMMRRPARLLAGVARGGARYLVVLIACAFVGYTIVYNLSPGYVLTGYLHRSVPFASYFVQIVLAFAVCSLLFLGRIELRRVMSRHRLAAWPPRYVLIMRSVVVGSLSIASVAVLSAYWLGLQHWYYRQLPPDHFAFLEKLELPPFKSRSFVVDTYSAPISVATKQWSYFDYQIGGAVAIESAEGPRIGHDPWTYVWLADKRVNDTYKRPDYFLCISPQNLLTVAARLSDNWAAFGNVRVGCSSVNLVRALIEGQDLVMQNTLVARDYSTRDRWAIVALNWNFPPSVHVPEDRRIPSVALVSKREGGKTWLTPIYRVNAASDAALRLPLLSLYRVGQPGDGCGGAEKPDALVGRAVEGDRIALPDGFKGRLRVGLRPRSDTRVGAEALSPIYQVEQEILGMAGTITRCAPQLPHSPKAVTVKRSVQGSMVILSWNRVEYAASYEVEMQSKHGEFLQIARLENWKLEHRVNDLAPHGHYCFRVRACSNVGCSKFSRAMTNDWTAGAGRSGPTTATRPEFDRLSVECSN